MGYLESIERAFAAFVPLCAVVAGLELLVNEKGIVLGFRSVCGLTIALIALRGILQFIQ